MTARDAWRTFSRLRRGALDRGATAVEYALLASFVAAVAAAAIALVGPALVPGFQQVSSKL
jgi:Flp pilus assembly pilin Flp